MFTKYMFNSLAYNPGFAGSPEYLSVRLLYRNQWWSFDGAPTTQSFTIHTPLSSKVGVGLSAINDVVGSTGSTTINASYAYRLQFAEGTLSIGLQGGIVNWRADWSSLQFRDPRLMDNVFEEMEPNVWRPTFGAGIFYYSEKFYAGLSVPRLIEWDLSEQSSSGFDRAAKLYRHYYFSAGGIVPINGNALIFKPSILIKSVGVFSNFSSSNTLNQIGAPTEFDIDLSLLFYETLWVGASFRSSFEGLFGDKSSVDSGDIWASFNLMNGMRIGAAYDYTLTKLQPFSGGSFELMLGYDFSYNLRKVSTPRYF